MHERTDPKQGLLDLPPRELLTYCEKTGEKISREEHVPLTLIVVDAFAAIDEGHARDLGELMLGDWKQTQTVLLRCRAGGESLNTVVYDVLDGFHRVEGRKMVIPDWRELKTTIRATVYYGCDDEEMIEQRIIAANSVKAVRFPRLGAWMKASWKLTPWEGKTTVAQAFGLAVNDSSGKYLGLSEEECKEVKDWARAKAKRWLMPMATIYRNLKTIEMAAPDLVIRTRIGAFAKGQLALTPVQLEILAELLPFRYESQRTIANYATARGLSTKDIRVVATLASKDKYLLKDRLQAMLTSGEWETQGYAVGEGQVKKGPSLILAIDKLRYQVKHARSLSSGQKENILRKIEEISEEINGPKT